MNLLGGPTGTVFTLNAARFSRGSFSIPLNLFASNGRICAFSASFALDQTGDENGIELKASVVDARNPDAVARQAQTLQDQSPNAKISTEAPESVIQKRAAQTLPQLEREPAGPVSQQTPQVDEALSADGIDFQPIPERRQPRNAELGNAWLKCLPNKCGKSS
jgi:hypothetical protein